MYLTYTNTKILVGERSPFTISFYCLLIFVFLFSFLLAYCLMKKCHSNWKKNKKSKQRIFITLVKWYIFTYQWHNWYEGKRNEKRCFLFSALYYVSNLCFLKVNHFLWKSVVKITQFYFHSFCCCIVCAFFIAQSVSVACVYSKLWIVKWIGLLYEANKT